MVFTEQIYGLIRMGKEREIRVAAENASKIIILAEEIKDNKIIVQKMLNGVKEMKEHHPVCLCYEMKCEGKEKCVPKKQ